MSSRSARTPPLCALLVALTAGALLGFEPLDVERGASGTWLQLLKLGTTASAMHVAAHPDEEAGGVMTRLARHDGARVASLTLTRGEAGGNALGPQAFDALGLLRTEELIVSNRYYGVDEQYFTTVADLGFTTRSDEAFARWGRHELLRDVVRVIRTSRPLVLFSRFQGTTRDGHGGTSAATLVMMEAFAAASNPAVFPEQIHDGLRPWRPLKLYIGASAGAPATITVDTSVYSPWLGQSYSELARRGLGFQRSSVSPVNARRHYVAAGPESSAFIRVRSEVAASPKEVSFFDGIDTSIRGAFRMLGKAEPSGAASRLAAIESAVDSRAYSIAAVATVDGAGYTDGYELVDQRDLELRYLYRPATMQVRGVDVRVVPGLTVAYVMGVGDHVPAGIAQLGYPVTLLNEADLAAGDLTRFDTIVTGTRAYAVRLDLVTHHQRLLDYARQGGNLVVLYNTHELVPDRLAPYPGQLPPAAEEVSEEDSPVEILAPEHQSLTWPNRITTDDFDGWVEQRGSKFWAAWDAAYTPVIAAHDQGQAPQRGGWLTTRHGRGTWTYFAYALHRQMPEGVPGAFRIVANLLALGKTPPARE